MNSKSESASSSRVLVFLMAAVVASFLLATSFTQYRESSIEGRVNSLVGNALPSVNMLSRARAELRALLEKIDLLYDDKTEQIGLRDEIRSGRMDLEATLQSYFSLPFFPGERSISRDVESELPFFDRSLNRFLDNPPIERAHEIREVHLRSALLDQALVRLVEFDSSQGRRLGLEISEIRAQSISLSMLLSLLAVGLAIAATVVAIRLKNASLNAIEERARELEIFAGRVAHDLKNPLSSMMLNCSLLRDQEFNERTRELIGRVSVTGKRMNQIIDGLLAFARSGAHPASGEQTEICSTLENTMSSVQPEAAREQINIQMELPPQPVKVACSGGVVDSILSNLIRNAVKYVADGGKPTREVKVRVRDLPQFAHIEVEDNGPGIDPAKKDFIFEPYFRGTKKHDGVGLGLATVKRLVESHGGHLGFASEFGSGSRFWVELPKAT